MRKNGTAKGTGRDMTFTELLRWLYRRHKLRRRYSADDQRVAVRRQYTAAAVFFLVLTLTLASVMTYLRLHYDTSHAVISLPAQEISAGGNPMLSAEEVTCSVSVTIGTTPTFQWHTPAMTVADMLADVGYTYNPDDIITPAPETVVEEGMQIDVVLVTFEESTEIVPVPYGTTYEDVQTIPRGTTERVSYGTDGIAQQVQRRRYENGTLTTTEVLSAETVTEPINEVLRRGVGGTVSGKHGTFSFSYYIDVTATAYGDYDEPRYTYTGTLARAGVIAVDPTVIPLGSKVYVKGAYGDYGYCSADDIGSGIKGNHIDIFMECSREEMMEFGIRNMRVYILD